MISYALAIGQRQNQIPVAQFLEFGSLYSAHWHCTCPITSSLDFFFFQTLAQHFWMLRSSPVCQSPLHVTNHTVWQGTRAQLGSLCCPAQPCRAQRCCSGTTRSRSIFCLWLASVKAVSAVQWLGFDHNDHFICRKFLWRNVLICGSKNVPTCICEVVYQWRTCTMLYKDQMLAYSVQVRKGCFKRVLYFWDSLGTIWTCFSVKSVLLCISDDKPSSGLPNERKKKSSTCFSTC